ncbi:Uncharacterized protein ALO63_05623 [Pseudomonas amygdali pv. mori]|uniref:Uncharacterized protein n=1 Tax=Pseudomonas amygdali pv. mori TaxID=34065 RepID=A0A0P9V2J5_PSEA0|nr:Uncharacterized protein ALO63_05623 [Pseudomonas amygdali pv. mori]
MPRRIVVIGRAECQHAQQDHLETATRIRGQRQVTTTNQTHLVIELHVFGRQCLGQRQHPVAVAVPVVDAFGQRLGNRHAVQNIENFREHTIPVRPLLGQVAYRLQHTASVAFQQRSQHIEHLTMIQCAEHGAHIGSHDLAFTKGNGLIGQAHRVTHRTVGSAPEQPQRIVFERHILDAQYVGQMFDHTFGRHVFQRELQATRQNGRRQLLRIGGSEDELDVGRRLFKRLEQGVERVTGEHVHFVDQVDLEATATWRVLHVIQQFARVFDLGAAGGVDLDQVDETAFIDLFAHRASATGRGGDAGLAVQALGDDPRDSGLADASRAGEQIGMVQALAVQRVDQGLQHMSLADHFAERARTPFTCKDLITHLKPSQLVSGRPPMLAEQGQNCIWCPPLLWLS